MSDEEWKWGKSLLETWNGNVGYNVDVVQLVADHEKLKRENAALHDLVKHLEEKQSEVRAAIWVLLEYVGIHQYEN